MKNDKAHLTAISRKAPSVPMRHLHASGLLKGRKLDFGCGKGKDADTYGMSKYDPTYHCILPMGQRFDTVTCNYVLNVVDYRSAARIILDIVGYMKDDALCYITVRRDIKEEGFTSRGTFQRNVILPFKTVKKTATFETYCATRSELIDYAENALYYIA